MCSIMKTFSRFWEQASGETDSRTFRRICRDLNVSPADINEILQEELGMDGEELLDLCRSVPCKENSESNEIFNSEPLRPQVEHGVGE